MKRLIFQYLGRISTKSISSFEDILEDRRLYKGLWIEFLLNPEIIKASQKYRDEPVIKGALAKAVSWYFAFRWLFKTNPAIEKLREKGNFIPFALRGEAYRREQRNFLKGIVYAGLC